jgi:hypothetical protein
MCSDTALLGEGLYDAHGETFGKATEDLFLDLSGGCKTSHKTCFLYVYIINLCDL